MNYCPQSIHVHFLLSRLLRQQIEDIGWINVKAHFSKTASLWLTIFRLILCTTEHKCMRKQVSLWLLGVGHSKITLVMPFCCPTSLLLSFCIMWHLPYKYYLGGGLAPSSNKKDLPNRAHLRSLEPKMRTTSLLILPLLVASIYAESKLPHTKYLYKIQILVQR